MTTIYAAQRGPNIANTIEAIGNRSTFDAGNFWGRNIRSSYDVYSYQTVIARWTEDEGWVLTTYNYSSTTNRHRGIIRRALQKVGVTYRETPNSVHPY